MIDLKKALNQARGSGRASTPRGRAIVEVHSFDIEANTATGKILDGMGSGEVITFELSGHQKVTDYTNVKHKAYVTPPDGETPGGSLQVEGLAKVDGKDIYKTRWIKSFQPKAADGQVMLNGETFTLRVMERRDGTKSANIDIADVKNETHATSVDALREAFIKAIDSHGAVTLMMETKGEPAIFTYFGKMVKQEDNSYVREPGADRLSEFESRLEGATQKSFDEVFTPSLEGSGISVVPTRSIRVGKDTWAATMEVVAKNGRGGPVDPASFAYTNPSVRFASAVKNMEVEADRKAVSDAFLAQANEDAKAKFHKGGFAEVEPRDIRSFLEGHGVNPIKLDGMESGYVGGSILLRPFREDKPDGDVMITKIFNITAPAPMPAVKAFAEMRQTYFSEMADAAAVVAEAALSSTKDKSLSDGDKPAPAAASAAATEAKVETPAEQDAMAKAAEIANDVDEDSIDALLGDLADRPIP